MLEGLVAVVEVVVVLGVVEAHYVVSRSRASWP